MAKFSEQFIQQVAQATDIVDLISGYVALKKKGREFVGLCPFHQDKNPSMFVTPTKQIFKCFACGAGGGVFQFMMLYEKMQFPEAVRALAERANIALPRENDYAAPAGGIAKNDLMGIMTFAARFFRQQLRTPAGESALEYARKRGLTDESIDRFGIGYALPSWDGLLLAARREGIGEEAMLTAGLIVKREGASGCYDRFRNRLMFPIIDPQGRVIAFGGRALDPNDRAKYLNSPDTPLFDKSSQLYALNWAREPVASGGQAVVVEGYMDALIPHQAGVNNVVATLGTALTDRHVQLLGRYASEIVLVFDADVAGAAAAERGLEMFLAQQVQVRVATIPSGKDPCDYTLAEGGEAFKALLASAPDALEYAWLRRSEALRQAGDNLADRRKVVEDFLTLVANSAAYGAIDPVRRGQLAQHIGHLLNIPSGDLQQMMAKLNRRVSRSSGVGSRPGGGAQSSSLSERHILEVLLNRPELFDDIAERLGSADFTDSSLGPVVRAVWQLGLDGRLSCDELLTREDMASHGALIAELATSGERRGNFEQTLAGAVEHMVYRRNRSQLQELRGVAGDDESLRQLAQHLRTPDVRRLPKIR